jgi:2-oxoglutarate ferredoxin oxidoreductase subunit alpha
MNDIDWKIGGVGGMGAMGVGYLFSKTLFRSGYFVVDYNEYNSIIKGGNNSYQVRASKEKVNCTSNTINLLLALDQYSIGYFKDFKNENSLMICDLALVKDKSFIKIDQVIDIPFSIINKEIGGDEIMKNIIGLGASLSFLDVDITITEELIRNQFKNKGQEVIDKNLKLLNKGYDYVREKYLEKVESFIKSNGDFKPLADKLNPNRFLLTGNESIGVSAIASGIGYYAAYPMTPASSILHYLAPKASHYNFVVKHAEDEISAINSAIGASFAGTRSMVASSGGGFSLMVEGLGLAAITETPIVIALISRPGPATGMPTWTDQADLQFALHASQGEFLRIVLTPGDVEECFYLTNLAFILSEKYHIPAIILSDKYLAEGRWSCSLDKERISTQRYSFVSDTALSRIQNYERYAPTPSGITSRSIPGMKNGIHLANSDEHNYYGLSDETSEMRQIQMDKRNKNKLARLKLDMPKLEIRGDLAAPIGIISFGSVKNVILEVLKYKNNLKFLHIPYVSPFPEKDVLEFIQSCSKFVIVENNMTGQLNNLIKENCCKKADLQYLKDDGRPIFYTDILDFLNANGY